MKSRLIVGGIIAMALITGIILGGDGTLKTILASIVGYLFGTASK